MVWCEGPCILSAELGGLCMHASLPQNSWPHGLSLDEVHILESQSLHAIFAYVFMGLDSVL